MSKYKDGCYDTDTGIALVAKVLAGHGSMKYIRAAMGKGNIPDELTPKTMKEPAEYVMDAKIIGVSIPADGECQVTIQVNSKDVSEGFYCTGIMLYAEDPDDGEVPFTYMVLENEPEWIKPSSDIVGKLATFDIVATVGAVDKVAAVIDPKGIATVENVKNMIEAHNEEQDVHQNMHVAFEEADKRENITSGEKLSTLFGKIKKWFSDLKSVAFTGKYSDLSDTPEALKNPHALKFTGAATVSYDGSADKTVEIPEASDTAPQAPGTAKAGSGKTWARSDHVHPLQTSVTGSSGSCTGNAETASKLKHTVVDGNTLNTTPGTFAFSGNNGPFPGEDWVGLQIGDSVDKFQLLVRGNRLYARQNDVGGANVTWSEWKQYAYTTEIPTLLSLGGVWDYGDSFNFPNNTPLNGIITSSSKNIHLMLPLGKPVKNGLKVHIYLTGTLRGAKGYINNSGEESLIYENDSSFSKLTYALDYESGTMRITLTEPSGFTNVDNNTPVSFLATNGSSFYFYSGTYDEPLPGPEIFGDDAGMEGPSMEDGVGSQEKEAETV